MLLPTIPQDIAIVLAGIATYISNRLQDDGLPSWKNELIAGAAFIALSLICMWLLGGFTGNPRDMINYFFGLTLFLAVNELSSLLKWLRTTPSPLAPKTQSVRPTVTDWNKFANKQTPNS